MMMLFFSKIHELFAFRKAFINTQREMMLSILVLCVFTLYYCPLSPKTTPLTFRKTEVWLSAYHGQAPFVKK